MINALRYQLDGLRNTWDNGLEEEVRRSAFAFIILWLLFFAACVFMPDLRETLVKLMFSTLDNLHVTDENGRISATALLFNNVEATALIMIYGLIPFIRLPALSLGVNAMMLGVMASLYIADGMSPLIYMAALLPHGIFELPALALAFGMGLYICGQTTRRCRGDTAAHSVWSCLVLISRMLLLVLVPLLIVSALVEAYVTPLFLSLF